MKPILYVTFFLSFSFILSCKEQKEASYKNRIIVPDSIKYEFINFFIHSKSPINLSESKFIAEKDTSQLPYPTDDSSSLVSTIIGIDGFTQEDGIFIWKQIAEYYNFTLSSAEIKDRAIISPAKWRDLPHDKYWDNIYHEYKTDKFCSISMPLFSIDLLTVIVSLNDYDSYYGKRAATYVYKKINGEWKYHAQLSYFD